MSSLSLRTKKSNLESPVEGSQRPSSAPYDDRLQSVSPQEVITPSIESILGSDFVKKYGSKYYASGNIPWPLSYDNEVIEADILFHQLLKETKGLTIAEFPSGPPRKVLDLGTGTATWILDAAQKWTTTEFVGFDIVPIQPDLDALDPSVRCRVQWVIGDFLQTLPFPNESFDFVRCVNIAQGVPESNWGPLFEEIARVLMPGGNLEVIVENIVFPYVPRIVPQSPSVPSTPIRTTFALENHDHSFLEEVFFSIFDRRFINVKPTSIVPASMNLYLRGVSEVPLQVPASTQSPKEKQRTTLPGAPGNAKSTVPFPQTDASVNRFSGWANELRAWQKVLGCKETMWEEILEKNRVLQKDILDDLLWSPNERELLSSRGRFDLLFSRYAQEMRQRIRLASKLMKGIGWIEPGQCVENTLGVLQGDLDVLEGGKIALSQSPGGEEIDATQQISCWVAHKGEDFQLQAR